MRAHEKHRMYRINIRYMRCFLDCTELCLDYTGLP